MKNDEVFVIAPAEIAFYLRERWIGEIDAGHATVADLVLPYLEDEAIGRFGKEWTAPKDRRPDKRKDREAWRGWWLNEARHNCDSFSPVPRAGQHLTPIGESAVNLLVIASELRDALETGKAQMACALGMLLISEVIAGGYSIEVEATAAAKVALERAARKPYDAGIGRHAKDLARAKDACIAAAKVAWMKNKSKRIGTVAEELRRMLIGHLDKLPTLTLADIPGIATVKTWLRDEAKAGKLTIPDGAQRRGRPPKAAA